MKHVLNQNCDPMTFYTIRSNPGETLTTIQRNEDGCYSKVLASDVVIGINGKFEIKGEYLTTSFRDFFLYNIGECLGECGGDD